MKIGVDIDDTLTNTKEMQIVFWKEYHSKYPNENYTNDLPDNINEFGEDYIEKYWDIYRDRLTFNTTYKNDCSKILKQLKKEGYTLCIITSRPKEKYKDYEKRQKESFNTNDIPISEIYTNIRNKAEFCKNNNIGLLIDDSIKHIEECDNLGIKAILFNKNKNYKGLQTNNWNEIYEIIKDKLN